MVFHLRLEGILFCALIKISPLSDSSPWYKSLSGIACTMLTTRKKGYACCIGRDMLPGSEYILLRNGGNSHGQGQPQNIVPVAVSCKVLRQTIKDPLEFFKSRSA